MQRYLRGRSAPRTLGATALAGLVATFLFSAEASAEPPLPRTTYGGIGLIEMPSARMAPDGMLSLSASYFDSTQRYTLDFQALPWLEGAFRYSGLQHFNPSYPVYWDRSFSMKARLWNEGRYLPTVAVGVNDLIGTGIYGGEYLVASKQFGDIDATIGMGWGRLGTAGAIRNPLGALSSSLYKRGEFTSLGGDFNFGQYFHSADAGIFGGLAWRTPIKGLTLLGEYSSDSYVLEAARGNFAPRNQFNFGASYQATKNVVLGLNWLYGRSIGGNVSIQLDPTNNAYPTKIGSPPPPPAIRTAEEQQRALRVMLHGRSSAGDGNFAVLRAARNEMVDRLWRQKNLENLDIKGHTLILTVSDGVESVACLDAARILQAYGSDITTVQLNKPAGMPPVRCATPSAPDRDFQDGVFVGGDQFGFPSNSLVPAAVTIDARSDERGAEYTNRTATNAVIADARRQNIDILALRLTDSEATIYYENKRYFSEVDALDRLTGILMKDAPPDVEKFRIIAVTNGIPNRQFNILRAPLERASKIDGTADVFSSSSLTSEPPPMQNPVLSASARTNYPRFSWAIFPQLRQELFDPENPFGIQLVAALQGVLELSPGLSLVGQAETSLFDSYYMNRFSDSVLPHVRTDQQLYLAKGKTGIGSFEANYRFRLAPNVFAVARAGYLESMFGGIGGEVLWRPENQRWALGVDGYEVWQRNFDRLFGFQAYHVFTGHVSIYYASPWHNLNFALRSGQYLAGDRGITVEVTRRFSTGVEIGAFVTKTNVSAAQFGEGSFDKGIMLRIPLGWSLPLETQGEFAMDLRSIQRDGGQRLIGDTLLYNATRRSSQPEILNLLGQTSSN